MAAMRQPPTDRRRLLLALFAVSAIGVAATMRLAVDWAADLPKTMAFAIEREPFGPRSVLQLGNARDVLRRAAARLAPGDRVTAVHLRADGLSLTTRAADGMEGWIHASLVEEAERRETSLDGDRGGIDARRLAAVDLVAPLRAAERRWRRLGRPEPPLVSLSTARGRPRAWQIIFTSEVPERERSTSFDLDGRPLR